MPAPMNGKTLFERIVSIYPELKSDTLAFADGRIQLRNDMDGRGDYIEAWDHPSLARPTGQQLEAVQ